MKPRNFIDTLKELAIIVAIAVLTPLVIHHGSTLISPYPTQSSHFEMGTSSEIQKKIDEKDYKSEKELNKLKDNLTATTKYQTQLTTYQKTTFYICLVAGIILILTGLCINISMIDTGLIFGGTFSLISGYFTYWDSLANVLQFASLVIALLLVILISYFKLIKPRKSSSSQ